MRSSPRSAGGSCATRDTGCRSRSNSAPSGLTAKTIQISRDVHDVGDLRCSCRSPSVSQRRSARFCSSERCSRAWWSESNRTSGSVSSRRDVVGDLGDPDLAALVALADREDVDDVRVGGLGRLEHRDHLGVAVVPAVLGREIGGGDGGRSGRGGRRRHEGEDQRAASDEGGGSAMHGTGCPSCRVRPSRDGATPHRDRGNTTARPAES